MPKLTDNTVVVHPKTGEVTQLAAGDDVPKWATSLIGAHLLDEQAVSRAEPDGSLPPKSGVGATIEAWAAYARAQEVEVPDGANRDDIIAAVFAAGKPVEKPAQQ